MTGTRPAPEMSVVLTVVDGGPTLTRCLEALTTQAGAPALEVIVPWDESVPEVGPLAARFPGVRFPTLGRVETRHPTSTPGGQHELYDRRRAAGLAQASAPLVAILEDRGIPRPDWAERMLALHRSRRVAAVGGAVENGQTTLSSWAAYFCDFTRYQPPFVAGPRPYITDVNICYRREALEATRDLWQDRYHETVVHWALLNAGEVLWLSPEPIVDQQRTGLRPSAMFRERRDWGRLFAYTRVRELSPAKRLALILGTPVLPLVLFARHAVARLGKRRQWAEFVAASPLVLMLLAAWSWGELSGYLTRRP
jgi:hypothetical protein